MSLFQVHPDSPPTALDSTVSPGAVIGYVVFDEYARITPIISHPADPLYSTYLNLFSNSLIRDFILKVYQYTL
jgi:hypothetical protein